MGYIVLDKGGFYSADQIQHLIDVAVQQQQAADGVAQAAAVAAAVATATANAVADYIAAHPVQQPGIFNASTKSVDLHLPDGSTSSLGTGAFYSAAALSAGETIDVLATGHSAFCNVVYRITEQDFIGDDGTNVTVDDGDTIASYLYADLTGNRALVITDYPDISAVVQSVIDSNPKRYFSCQNLTANDHVLRVVRADDETYTEHVMAAGCQFIYYADTDGMPVSGNEHYLRLAVGTGNVKCSVGSEAHAIAGDAVYTVDFNSGFVTGDICDTIGLWASSTWLVIRDADSSIIDDYLDEHGRPLSYFSVLNSTGADLNFTWWDGTPGVIAPGEVNKLILYLPDAVNAVHHLINIYGVGEATILACSCSPTAALSSLNTLVADGGGTLTHDVYDVISSGNQYLIHIL